MKCSRFDKCAYELCIKDQDRSSHHRQRRASRIATSQIDGQTDGNRNTETNQNLKLAQIC